MRAASTIILPILFGSLLLTHAAAGEPAKGHIIEKAQFLAPEPVPDLLATSTSPATKFFDEPEIIYEDATAQGCSGCSNGCSHDAACGSCGGCGSCGLIRCSAGCNMSQHHSYFPPLHGYYYFRPYHHSHVRSQQMLVQSWGGNPAHPYSNEIFEQVYKQYRAAGGAPTAQ